MGKSLNLQEYDAYDESVYVREDVEVRIPFSLFVDFAGTIKKLNDEYAAKIEVTNIRQREQDLQLLRELRKKYPDA